MKKALAILLTLVLCMGMMPTFAEGNMDEKLTQITLAVKEQLGIGDEYGEFSSEYIHGDRDIWYLYWRNPGYLSVGCDENGVISYYSKYEDRVYSYDSVPAFPKHTREEALSAAEEFLNRVCAAGEEAKFVAVHASDALYGSYWYFHGNFYWNGLPTDATFDINLYADDLKVDYFSRSSAEYVPQAIGDLPMAATVSKSDAEAKLKDAVFVNLEYVSDGNTAVLRYMPHDADARRVNAQTGETVVYIPSDEIMYARNMYAEDAAAAKGESGLSPAEQLGVERMKDVLLQDVLEAKLRENAFFGLDAAYILTSINYYIDGEAVLTRIAFERDGNAEGGYAWKTFLLDAKTGAIQDIHTVRSAEGYAEDTARIQEIAERFLRENYPEEFAQTMCTESHTDNSQTVHYRYTRLHDDIPMPENTLAVDVYADGTIDGFTKAWTDEITFQDSARAIPKETALRKYTDLFHAELCYTFMPENAVLFSYRLTGGEDVYAIDGATGECLYAEKTTGNGEIEYDNTDECAVPEQWLAMAQYGVGYADGEIRANENVTMRDLCGLLLSAYGVRTSDMTDEDIVREMGYRDIVAENLNGNPTRTEAAKIVAQLSGYCKAAELRGIYRCDFADAESIPEAEYGYIAIAQGLGIAQADADGNFRPNDCATREDAIRMLYALLDRYSIL